MIFAAWNPRGSWLRWALGRVLLARIRAPDPCWCAAHKERPHGRDRECEEWERKNGED